MGPSSTSFVGNCRCRQLLGATGSARRYALIANDAKSLVLLTCGLAGLHMYRRSRQQKMEIKELQSELARLRGLEKQSRVNKKRSRDSLEKELTLHEKEISEQDPGCRQERSRLGNGGMWATPAYGTPVKTLPKFAFSLSTLQIQMKCTLFSTSATHLYLRRKLTNSKRIDWGGGD